MMNHDDNRKGERTDSGEHMGSFKRGDMIVGLSVGQQLLLHNGVTHNLAQARTERDGCLAVIRVLCDVCAPVITGGAMWLVDGAHEIRTFGESMTWPPDHEVHVGTSALNHVANSDNAEWVVPDALPGANRHYLTPIRNWLGTAGVLALTVPSECEFDQALTQLINSLAWQLGIFIEHHCFASMADELAKARQLENEVRMALGREREQNDMKNRFISLVSHEFRTPLSIIQSSSELLERYYDRLSGEKRLRYFEQIRTSTMNMADMLQDILVLGRYDSGKTRFDPHPIDLTQYCRQCVEQIQQAAESRFQLVFEHRGVCEDAHMDDKLLWQIINNLLSNAMKYSPQPDPTIEMMLDIEGDHALLRFVDHGIGIPHEDQVRLFEPFHRGSNVGAVPGTGLGLSIVQRAVHEHHGEVQFNSIVGKGTTFTVSLPLR